MLLEPPLCDFGWKAPEFTLQTADNKPFTMSEQLGKKGLLIMFICNHCPYVQRIAKQLAQDTQTLMSEGINVLAVMSNDYQMMTQDAPENMLRFSSEHNFPFPYLVDHDQTVGKQYDAVCTPDFFGFNHKGELQYRGRLDDLSAKRSSDDYVSRTPELLNAMRLIAQTDKGPKQQTVSMGCSIKWRT
jgi:peroxiredoxin